MGLGIAGLQSAGGGAASTLGPGATGTTLVLSGTMTAQRYIATAVAGISVDLTANTGGAAIQLANSGFISFSVADPNSYLVRLAANTIQVGNGTASGFVAGTITAVTSVATTAITVGSTLAFSATAPSVSVGFGTSPAIAGRATGFTITIGTGGADSTGTLTFPAATTGWIVQFTDVTTTGSFVTSQTGGNTTTVTVQNYSRTTGLAIAWAAGDVLRCTAVAY